LKATPCYNLCGCRLRWRNGEAVQEQVMILRPGDVVGLALLMEAPIFPEDDMEQRKKEYLNFFSTSIEIAPNEEYY
jgi:hypothetical protein